MYITSLISYDNPLTKKNQPSFIIPFFKKDYYRVTTRINPNAIIYVEWVYFYCDVNKYLISPIIFESSLPNIFNNPPGTNLDDYMTVTTTHSEMQCPDFDDEYNLDLANITLKNNPLQVFKLVHDFIKDSSDIDVNILADGNIVIDAEQFVNGGHVLTVENYNIFKNVYIGFQIPNAGRDVSSGTAYKYIVPLNPQSLISGPTISWNYFICPNNTGMQMDSQTPTLVRGGDKTITDYIGFGTSVSCDVPLMAEIFIKTGVPMISHIQILCRETLYSTKKIGFQIKIDYFYSTIEEVNNAQPIFVIYDVAEIASDPLQQSLIFVTNYTYIYPELNTQQSPAKGQFLTMSVKRQ